MDYYDKIVLISHQMTIPTHTHTRSSEVSKSREKVSEQKSAAPICAALFFSLDLTAYGFITPQLARKCQHFAAIWHRLKR